ncbi:MAG: MarR family transcriptional regulator [Chloroflexota bacterium]
MRPDFQRLLATKVTPQDLQGTARSVTAHQLDALDRLYPNGLTMSALARSLGVTDGSAAVLSDRLVKQGLAVRRADLNDRRVVWLEPSPCAVELIERFRRLERQTVEADLHALDDAELGTFLALIERVAPRLSVQERAEL